MPRAAALAPLLLLALAGCVSFPAYPIAEERAATKTATRPGVSVRLTTSIFREVNDRPLPLSITQERRHQTAVAQAYADVGVDINDPQSPDGFVDVQVRHRGRAVRALNLLSAVTLFVSPSWSSSEYAVVTRIRRPKEDVPIGESSVSYSFRSYYHLLMLPFVATNAEGGVEGEVVFGLARRGLVEAMAKAAERDPRFRSGD